MPATTPDATATAVCIPWESSPSRGQESAPGDGAAAAEHHISADVALAFVRYVHASGDHDDERTDASPVLRGVAEWITSRVTRTDRGFEIKAATGIAERKAVHDNASFVNLTARLALTEALACADRLGVRRWTRGQRSLMASTSRRRRAQPHPRPRR